MLYFLLIKFVPSLGDGYCRMLHCGLSSFLALDTPMFMGSHVKGFLGLDANSSFDSFECQLKHHHLRMAFIGSPSKVPHIFFYHLMLFIIP